MVVNKDTVECEVVMLAYFVLPEGPITEPVEATGGTVPTVFIT